MHSTTPRGGNPSLLERLLKLLMGASLVDLLDQVGLPRFDTQKVRMLNPAGKENAQGLGVAIKITHLVGPQFIALNKPNSFSHFVNDVLLRLATPNFMEPLAGQTCRQLRCSGSPHPGFELDPKLAF